MRFPPAADASRQARRALRQGLLAAGLDADDDLADIVLLLASELFDNAVLHAGTAFDVEFDAGPDSVTVAVSDRGAGPLEQHLAQPRQRYGRAATHGRGLLLVQRLATTWGTRHDADGTHTIWFTVHRDGWPAEPAEPKRRPVARSSLVADPVAAWSEVDKVRRLLHVPGTVQRPLDAEAVVAELARRLREILDVDGVLVEADHGDGGGTRRLADDGLDPAEMPADRVLDVPLPVTAPLRGRLRIAVRPGGAPFPEIAELAAHRIALAVESGWLRGADRRRRAWMAYLADTSQLLGQSLDVELTVAVVPQVVVPRLGQWCAVHLADPVVGLTLGALTHADEDRIPELRAALDPAAGGTLPPGSRAQLQELAHRGQAPAWISWPSDGIAVPLSAAGGPLGVLSVGRPADRTHSPEDVALVTDIARRSALAIENAQRTAQHVATSQALQQALLPRALPTAEGVDFAAAYLPASTGSDVGGDFYDVLTLRPGHWLAAIGDVCGKGARAAARTGLVRDVLRVLVRDGRPLPHSFELLNDVMMDAGDPSQFCTLAAALLWRGVAPERPGLVVDLALGGHPRPVLVRAGGGAELVGDFGTALGLLGRVQVNCTRHHLAPGDMLLAYTDGVTESRGRGGLYGPDRLLAAASAAAATTAAELVAAVRASVEAHARDDRRDDIALLAVRATAGGSATDAPLR
jgi:sigma-B regulation protein RsbU (phosphoserine phosphatase)